MTETFHMRFYYGRGANYPLRALTKESYYFRRISACFGALRRTSWSQMGDILNPDINKVGRHDRHSICGFTIGRVHTIEIVLFAEESHFGCFCPILTSLVHVPSPPQAGMLEVHRVPLFYQSYALTNTHQLLFFIKE